MVDLAAPSTVRRTTMVAMTLEESRDQLLDAMDVILILMVPWCRSKTETSKTGATKTVLAARLITARRMAMMAIVTTPTRDSKALAFAQDITATTSTPMAPIDRLTTRTWTPTAMRTACSTGPSSARRTIMVAMTAVVASVCAADTALVWAASVVAAELASADAVDTAV